jgi:5-formyltetrahydrofolate cyclo-ligase
VSEAELLVAKSDMRRRLVEHRGRIDEATRTAWSDLITDRLLAELPSGGDTLTMLAFDGFGSEVRTERLLGELAANGNRVLLPFIREAEMEAAEMVSGLVQTSYGPREPEEARAIDPSEIDVAVVPGLAFDLRSHRLGYGRGHFDRFLRRVRPDALRMGVAFELQLVEEVPHGPQDERVDAVVTERRTVWCEPPRAARR